MSTARKLGVYLLAAVAAYLPMLFTSGAYWDGAAVIYAFESGNYSLLRQWFFSAGLPLHYYLNMLLVPAFALMGQLAVDVFVIGCLVAFAAAGERLLRMVFDFSPIHAFVGGLLILLFPLFHVLMSAIHLFHVFFIALFHVGLVGLLHHSRFRPAGHGAMALAYSFNSLLVYSYAILAAVWIFRRNLIPRTHFVVWAALPPLFFLLKTFTMPTYGYFEGYNTLILATDSVGVVRAFFASFENLLFRSLLLAPLVLLLLRAGRREFLILGTAAVIAAAAIFPYAAVGKYISGWDTDDRLGLLIAFPAALSLVCLISAARSPRISRALMSVLILFFAYALIAAQMEWVGRPPYSGTDVAYMQWEQTGKRVPYFDEQFAGETPMTGWDELIEEKERILETRAARKREKRMALLREMLRPFAQNNLFGFPKASATRADSLQSNPGGEH